MNDPVQILGALDPSAPALTWYGSGGERVDLSGRVLTQWVTKTANLLAGDLDVAAGAHVVIDLPPHWRNVVWSLACWTVGAHIHRPGGVEPDADGPVVTTRPQEWAGAEVVAVPLTALAMRWDGDLPAGAIDGATEVMGQPDQLVLPSRPSTPEVSPAEPGLRLLLVADDGQVVLERSWAVWRRGGSVVLVAPGETAALAQIGEQEHARS